MPREIYQVSPISPRQTVTTEAINRVITEINAALQSISQREAALEGRDGNTATFASNVQLNGNRVCGVGRSQQDDEVVPRSELVDKALYARRGIHRTTLQILAEAGIKIPRNRNKDFAIPAGQIEELVNDAIPTAADVPEVTGAITGASTDGAMEDIPDPADTPATADALRDDLVANALPAIRNNIEEIHETQDAIIQSLQAAGLMAT